MTRGFFPGRDFDYANLEKKEPSGYMTVPLVILAALAVLLGISPRLDRMDQRHFCRIILMLGGEACACLDVMPAGFVSDFGRRSDAGPSH